MSFRTNRPGYELEAHIGAIMRCLVSRGIHCHKNHPLRSFQGVYLHGEPFDYEIFTADNIHLFDAKECSDRKMHWGLREFSIAGSRHFCQLENLHMCTTNLNVLAYFLVWFKAAHQEDPYLICFSTDCIFNAIEAGRKYLTPEDGFRWPILYMLTSKNY